MHLKNRNHSFRASRARTGQALVESALILMVLLMSLIAIVDFAQLLFTRQMLVERTRSALRWGMIHAWDGTGDGIKNMILYNRPTVQGGGTFAGLTRSNIRVTYNAPTVANPNDTRLKVAIVDYRYRFFTPFLAKSFTNNSAVIESSPYLYRN
jgi:TadE-like protein